MRGQHRSGCWTNSDYPAVRRSMNRRCSNRSRSRHSQDQDEAEGANITFNVIWDRPKGGQR